MLLILQSGYVWLSYVEPVYISDSSHVNVLCPQEDVTAGVHAALRVIQSRLFHRHLPRLFRCIRANGVPHVQLHTAGLLDFYEVCGNDVFADAQYVPRRALTLHCDVSRGLLLLTEPLFHR